MSNRAPKQAADTRHCERSVTRRQYVRGIGRGIAGTGGIVAASGTAAAEKSVEDFHSEKSNSTAITDDRAWLEYYRPLLDLRHVPYSNRPTLRGWRFTSSDADVETEVGVFCCEYGVQDSGLSLTSHSGDHEWIYVYVDEDTGEVTEVSYAAYHWLRGYVRDPPLHTEDGGEHPMFLVADTYHNYIPRSDAGEGVLLDVSSLGDPDSLTGGYYGWLKNGMNEDIQPGAVHDPWRLAPDGPLDAWWSEDSARKERLMVDTWAWIGELSGYGVRGYDTVDAGGADL